MNLVAFNALSMNLIKKHFSLLQLVNPSQSRKSRSRVRTS